MQLFYQPAIGEKQFHLDADESRHCIRVLRKKEGDLLDITDGKGFFYKAKITKPDFRKCEFEILSREMVNPPKYYIHIAIAPTKNLDRMEWFVEKSVELGVDEITFLHCENSERHVLKTHRLLRKAVSAMKQSIKAGLPKMSPLIEFQTFIDNVDPNSEKFIAYVNMENPKSLFGEASKAGNYCVLIGPEGDFSQKELKLAIYHSFKKVSLGQSRLRTETAGIAACHTLNLINS